VPDTEKKRQHVLFIDDNDCVLEVTALKLERLGYAVTTTNNPEHALSLFEAAPEKFDLVITDQCMPVLTGLELAQRLCEISPNVLIILITGLNDTLPTDVLSHAGIAACLPKTASKQELAELIEGVING
jgi:CheY-like chemotaxis protein